MVELNEFLVIKDVLVVHLALVNIDNLKIAGEQLHLRHSRNNEKGWQL